MCPVHNYTRHIAAECREIKKLAEQFREMIQQRQDGAPSCQREGKQKVDSQEQKDAEMEFQDAKRALKAVYGYSDSESSDNERRKMLHVMFGDSWVRLLRQPQEHGRCQSAPTSGLPDHLQHQVVPRFN
jgi:hypothetical protein